MPKERTVEESLDRIATSLDTIDGTLESVNRTLQTMAIIEGDHAKATSMLIDCLNTHLAHITTTLQQ